MRLSLGVATIYASEIYVQLMNHCSRIKIIGCMHGGCIELLVIPKNVVEFRKCIRQVFNTIVYDDEFEVEAEYDNKLKVIIIKTTEPSWGAFVVR